MKTYRLSKRTTKQSLTRLLINEFFPIKNLLSVNESKKSLICTCPKLTTLIESWIEMNNPKTSCLKTTLPGKFMFTVSDPYEWELTETSITLIFNDEVLSVVEY